MTLSSQLGNAVAETCLPMDQCNACTRQGLPILPLRHAVVPRSEVDSSALSDTKMGLRILRAGYLYVLLDMRVWQAYQVTPDGYLRQFNPDAPPAANETLLCDACTSANHDAPASFLNIDTQKYTQAWLAFASDPWPRSVLDAYKDNIAPERFRKLDLRTARDNPDRIEDALVMTAANPRVNHEVHEYQRQRAVGDLDKVHGFHSRVTRVRILKDFLRNTVDQQALNQGVLALVLDDTVGLVQQYNYLRNGWIEARQRYIEEPMRAYKHQTSDLLIAIRNMHPIWAEQQTASFEPMTGDGPPTFGNPDVERQRVIQQKIRDYDASLEKRYSEADRASFEKNDHRELENYQHYIDWCAKLYAELCRSTQFKRIEQYDYDGADFTSGLAYSQTMTLCLRGGVSEAPPLTDERLDGQASSPDNGPTALLWVEWLKDPKSPVYRAVLMRDKSLLAGLLPSFSTTSEIDWNDSEKLYSAVTKALTSEESSRYVQPYLQAGMAQLLGALNAASARLQPILGPGVACAVSRLNSASQLLYNGIHLTELKIQIKLSEYYALQCEQLRNLQSRASEAIRRSAKGIKATMGEVNHEAQKVHRKVAPLIRTGLLSLAVLDPKVANQLITISVWVEGEVDKLRQDLMRKAEPGVDRVGSSAHHLLQEITVGVGSLDPRARATLRGLLVSAEGAANLVRTGFTGLRGVAGSGQLLLALGGFYLLNDSMKKNFEEVERVLGDKAPEAKLALYGATLGVLAGGVEVVGIALEAGAGKVQQMGGLSTRAAASANASFRAGQMLARTGAVIGAVTGLFDATQAGMAASRAMKAGDISAKNLYIASASLSGFGAAFGITAAVYGATALMGPMGIAILLGMIGYGFFQWARSEESTPLERWARRCVFGYADETPKVHWNQPEHAPIAIAELNAATFGVEADVRFRLRLIAGQSHHRGGSTGGAGTIAQEARLEYRLVLPCFHPEHSDYQWTLRLLREGDNPAKGEAGEVAASGNLVAPLAPSTVIDDATPTRKIDYHEEPGTPIVSTRSAALPNKSALQVLDISGALVLKPQKPRQRIEGAILSLTYWPDRSVSEGYAALTLTTYSNL
ncbi:hypothetical protein D3C84_313020 [compost metagenome]